MAEVTGLSGIFLRMEDLKSLYEWYERHLGLRKGKEAYAFPAPWIDG